MKRIFTGVTLAASLAVTGSALLIVLTLSSGPTQAGNKVEICHIPPGNPENFQILNVSQKAVQAHLAHGDILGSCFLDACPCASLDGWDDDVSTLICDASVSSNSGILEGFIDDSRTILVTRIDFSGAGEFLCKVPNFSIVIDEAEFEACVASMLEIAANDGKECTDNCGPGEVPPC